MEQIQRQTAYDQVRNTSIIILASDYELHCNRMTINEVEINHHSTFKNDALFDGIVTGSHFITNNIFFIYY